MDKWCAASKLETLTQLGELFLLEELVVENCCMLADEFVLTYWAVFLSSRREHVSSAGAVKLPKVQPKNTAHCNTPLAPIVLRKKT